jgi:hypothetical protein
MALSVILPPKPTSPRPMPCCSRPFCSRKARSRVYLSDRAGSPPLVPALGFWIGLGLGIWSKVDRGDGAG